MNESSNYYLLLGQNIVLMVALTFFYSLLTRWLLEKKVKLGSLAYGCLFASIAIISMQFPVEFLPGVWLDSRFAITILSAPFGGLFAGIFTTIIVSLYRLFLGGPGAINGFALTNIAGLIGILYFLKKTRLGKMRATHFFLMGLLIVLFAVFSTIIFLDKGVATSALEALIPPAAIFYPIGVALSGKLLLNEQEWQTTQIELRENEQRIRQAYDQTLEGWAKTLELRDEETEGHSQRVVELTVALCKKIGLSVEEIQNAKRGALLHDIGKIGIPDNILHKKGKLDEDEWETMKKHPVYACESLAGISFLEKALDIPCSHHEKWDGTGYPRGLKGEQIPLAARIFAVVDVWDSLLSACPYRDAWPLEKVIAYIQEQSGAHFDPEVVDAFLDLLTESGCIIK